MENAPFWRKMHEWTLSAFSREKDSIHSGISLQKGALIVHYGFGKLGILCWLLGFTRQDLSILSKNHKTVIFRVGFFYHVCKFFELTFWLKNSAQFLELGPPTLEVRMSDMYTIPNWFLFKYSIQVLRSKAIDKQTMSRHVDLIFR